MPDIGIVGAGVAGLHLGLFLRQHDIPVTIYTDKTTDQIEQGRLLNTVAHHHCTRERERQLGINHWDAPEYSYSCHNHYIGGDHPLIFRGDFVHPSYAIDYRIYLPTLFKDFVERGGNVVIQTVNPQDLATLAEHHDLLVVAVGRGSYNELFKRVSELSPFDRPQRLLCAGLYHGVQRTDPVGVTLSVSPGYGELVEIPIYSFAGHVTTLLFENVPGGDLEILAQMKYDDDLNAFEQIVLEKLEQHHPTVYERVDRAQFHLTRPLDILQGAVLPGIRQPYTRLENGKFAVTLGDAYMTLDPVTGQGANAASYSAWKLGEAIINDFVYDERFCQRVERERQELITSVSRWTNFMISPPRATPHRNAHRHGSE